MKIFILTEGSKDIGLGHITRCMSIYQAFERYDFEPIFIVNGNESVASGLGDIFVFDWINESEELFDRLENADIVIIDSYLAPNEIYEEISTITKLLVSIDDNNRLVYPEGIILNGSINAADLDYPLNNNSEYLLGPEYTPLRKEFWDDDQKIIRKTLNNIMMTFGGADSANLTPRVLELLTRFYPELGKNIVIGSGFKNVQEIKNVSDTKTELHYNLNASQMKQLMVEADITISSGGQTIYELAKIGVPCIIVGIAENQLNHIEGWKNAGFVLYAGWKDDQDLLENILQHLFELKNHVLRERKSEVGRKSVDGAGSLRVVKKIISRYLNDNLVLKEAGEKHLELVFDLSNDPEVRKHSFNPENIGFDEHVDWYLNKLKSENYLFLIVEAEGEFLGQVRFENRKDNAIISISLVKRYRGLGIGAEILKRSIEVLKVKSPQIRKVIAQVKVGNIHSKNLFLRSGFILVGERRIKEINAMELEYDVINYEP